MENNSFPRNREDFPQLMSARDLEKTGLSRTLSYQMLNRSDVPVIQLGGRKFLNRDRFFEWLDDQTQRKGELHCSMTER